MIHSGYIQDAFKIQCSLTLRYMTHKIHRDTFEDMYLEPYLRARLDARGDEFICTHPVSRMYPACIPHVSFLPLQIHVSRMYLACILHLRYVPIRIYLRYMYLNMYL